MAGVTSGVDRLVEVWWCEGCELELVEAEVTYETTHDPDADGCDQVVELVAVTGGRHHVPHLVAS